MQRPDSSRNSLVLLLALAPQDKRALARVLGEEGLGIRQCTLPDFSREFHAGVGVVVFTEETLTVAGLKNLADLVGEQPLWSDVPLIILTASKAVNVAHIRMIQHKHSLQNATFLERPLRVSTFLQAIKVALRNRQKQYALRDQLVFEAELRKSSETNERRLYSVLNNTRMSVFFLDERQHCIFMNASAENLTGYSLAECRGRTFYELVHHSRPDGSPYPLQECPIDNAFPENYRAEGTEVFIHKDGHFYPVSFTASPLRQSGKLVGTVIEVRDITDEVADAQRLRMMMDELNHRVKNTLATVNAIIHQTLRGEVISDIARKGLISRIKALSLAHDVLTEAAWVGTPLQDLVSRVLAPFSECQNASAITVFGDEFELRPQPAVAIAMALHELATNAAKYGALSVHGGGVSLSWTAMPDGILKIRWVERDGPTVSPPGPRGFGRRLIEQGLAHELGGDARIDFHPQGVICEINMPMAAALVEKQKVIQ